MSEGSAGMRTEMDRQLPAYHLVRSPGRGGEAPTLDTAQRAVVDHGGGPLLVLAGPGPGQTTTVSTIVVVLPVPGPDHHDRGDRGGPHHQPRDRPGAGARPHLQPQG